jgi:hypothetical protein
MTAVWGPLGWMTLHSVATIYPESPTQSERDLMGSFLDMFRDTITCVHCKDHFTSMLENYRRTFPNMLESRHEFAMFSFRAHNAVNRRLNKPVQLTVSECMGTLQNNIKTRSAREYRNAYFNHIWRYWSTLRDVTGIVALKKIQELKKIEYEYLSSRDTNFQVEIRSDVTALPRDVLEKDPQEIRTTPMVFSGNNTRAGFRITSKGIRLR